MFVLHLNLIKKYFASVSGFNIDLLIIRQWAHDLDNPVWTAMTPVALLAHPTASYTPAAVLRTYYAVLQIFILDWL